MAAAVGGWGGQHGTSGVAASGGSEPPRQPHNNGGPKGHNFDPRLHSNDEDDDIADPYLTLEGMNPCHGCISTLFETGSLPECISHSCIAPCTECQRRQRECVRPARSFTGPGLQAACDNLFRVMGKRTIRPSVHHGPIHDEDRPSVPSVPQELAQIFSPAALARWSGPVDNNILVNLDRLARGVISGMGEIQDRVSRLEAGRIDTEQRERAEPITTVAAQVPSDSHGRVVRPEFRQDNSRQALEQHRPVPLGPTTAALHRALEEVDIEVM